MSALINSMFSNQVEWHNEQRLADRPLSGKEALEFSGLDWRVALEPVEHNGHASAEFFKTVRMDTLAMLGIVRAQYHVIQNIELFNLLAPVIGDGQFYETAGSLIGGRRVWALARLPREYYVVQGDWLRTYIAAMASHDGSLEYIAAHTDIRVVCNNTMNAALSALDDNDPLPPIHIKHTAGAEYHIAAAHQMLGLATKRSELLEQLFGSFARMPMTPALLTRFLKSIFPSEAEDDGKRPGSQVRISRDLVQGYFELKINNPAGAQGTAWSAWNAVTHYTDHGKVMQPGASRMDWSWMGPGNDLKKRAMRWLTRLVTGKDPK